jgi:hypothetical protein
MGDSSAAETVRVVVRCRPLNSKEKADGREQIVHMDSSMGSCVVAPSGAEPKNFTFDAVYGTDSTQAVLYQQTASKIVDSVIEGYNGTIFAYGQTGTGKTFTMEGVNHDEELQGIIPRAFQQIFKMIEAHASEDREFLVRASYLEIYNEEIRDLLSKNSTNKLELKENPDTGVYVRDLTSYVVKSTRECDKLRDFGAKNRHVGATAMNQDSSRSHSIYTITVEQCETYADGSTHIRMGKLNLVDLAGSERQSKTQASGDRLKEATKINLSLSALGNVISSLVDGKSQHIPYRDSKLTRLLQDSLGGNTKTVMVANLGPADWNYDETLSTLRYANRAKNIKNKPKINEDPKDAMLREFQEEIAKLKAKLERAGGGGGGRGGSGSGDGGPIEKVVNVVQEKIVEVVKHVEVEKVVEKEKFVEVEREVEVERIVEVPVEVEKVVEVVHEVPVEKVVEVEKLVGVREEEVEAMKQRLKQEAESKRRQIERATEQTQAEIARQQETFETEQQRALDEQAERERVRAELEALEAKIFHGGEHVSKRVARQEAEIAEQQRLIEERRQEEVKLRQKAAEEEEKKLAQEEKYSSLREEAESKTRKLKQLWSKFRAAQSEVEDLQMEQQQEKQDLLHTVRELTRQVQLQNLVIDSFVPPEEVSKLERRAAWDEDSEQWRLLPFSEGRDAEAERRPKSHPSLVRPTSFMARRMAADLTNNDPRYRSVNVLSFDLDMPERTTADYEGDVNPNVRAALTAALRDDEQLEVDAEENLPSMGGIGGNGWTPGGMPDAAGGGLGRVAAGMSASIAASKLRQGAGERRKPKLGKSSSRKKDDDELDALLNGGGSKPAPAAAEQFPTSRGLGSRRRQA